MSKKRVLEFCKKKGYYLDDNSSANYYDVTVWTNNEYLLFSTSSASCLCLSWLANNQKNQFWKELLNQLLEGTI